MALNLIEAAAQDLLLLSKKNRALTHTLVKKLLLISEEPEKVGLPLSGSLAGMRKIKVGDRIWRIVWKVLTRRTAEVWGIGKRDHSEIYREVEQRIKKLGEDPETISLAQLISSLRDKSIPVIAGEIESPDIIRALHIEMGLSIETIQTLTSQQAESLYERYLQKVVKEL